MMHSCGSTAVNTVVNNDTATGAVVSTAVLNNNAAAAAAAMSTVVNNDAAAVSSDSARARRCGCQHVYRSKKSTTNGRVQKAHNVFSSNGGPRNKKTLQRDKAKKKR